MDHLRLDDAVLLSNSMLFLAARAGVRPRLGHSNYYRERSLSRSDPAHPPPLVFSGNTAIHHELLHALVIDDELTIHQLPLDRRSRFTDYASYRAMVREELTKIVANAHSAHRRHPLDVVTTISNGYDSPACAVLAAEAGCTRALTVARSEHDADSGIAIAEALGLEVEVCHPDAWESDRLPEAELLATGGTELQVRVLGAEHALRRSVLLDGHYGDRFWSRDRSLLGPGAQRPHDYCGGVDGYWEVELRLGSAVVSVPAIGIMDGTIFEIANSRDMAPWQVGGDYDRPIPRRILEEAGIARGAFAQRKLAGAYVLAPRDLTPASKADYERWLAAHPGGWRRLARNSVMRWARPARQSLRRIQGRVPRAGRLADRLARHRTLRWEPAHLFHWAFERTLDRYEAAAPSEARVR